MRSRTPRIRRLLASAALAGLTAMTAAGCNKTTASRDSTGSITDAFAHVGPASSRAPRSEDEWRREANTLGERYRANPKDAANALRYSEALRQTRQFPQAAAVLQQATIYHPNNKQLLGAYGRALADAGQLEDALIFLSRAHTPDQPDWRVLSAQGAVLDQMGRHEEARRSYDSALRIAPDEASVLSNLGLSYMLSKDLAQAERALRRAAERRANDRRVRQNLALVVGLQGRFQEAEQIARADLPPEEAAENITYLRQMLAEQESPKPSPRRPRGRTS
jgi:Flp pilus assembly protein TadD